MDPRQKSVIIAHTSFVLVQIFMVLEVLWINKHETYDDPKKFILSIFCVMAIGAMMSGVFLLRGGSLKNWLFAAFLLVLHGGAAVSEAVEDFLPIVGQILTGGNIVESILRLCFIISLTIPFVTFGKLLLTDVKPAFSNRN